MSQEIKNVLIIGANGNVGPAILKALDESPNLTVSVLIRKGSKATYSDHIKVHAVDEHWPEDQLLPVLKDQDAVVLTLTPTDVQKVKNLIDYSIKAGVKRFLPSEFGSDMAVDKIVELVPLFQPKREIKEYLVSKESTGLTWTGIINGGFFDWGLETGFLSFDLKSHTATFYEEGKNLANLTNLSTVGAAVVATLKRPAETANQFIYIADFTVSQQDILAALEKATGAKWKTTAGPDTAAMGQDARDRFFKGDYSAIPPLLLSWVYSNQDGANFAKNRELQNDKLGLPRAGDLNDVVAKIVKGEKV